MFVSPLKRELLDIRRDESRVKLSFIREPDSIFFSRLLPCFEPCRDRTVISSS